MTLNILLEASPAFNFKNPNKVKIVGINFEKAQRLLNIADKSEIDRLKKDVDFVKSDRGENLLTAVNIAAKVGHKIGSKYGEEKVAAANELLGKLEVGFPAERKELRVNPFFKETNKAFNDKYERHHPELSKETEPVTEKPEEAPKAKKEPAPIKQPTPEKPEEPEAKEEPTGTSVSFLDIERPKGVPATVKTIEDLRSMTSPRIQKISDKLGASESLTTKAKKRKVDGVLNKYQKQITRYVEKAKAGPKNAAVAFSQAKQASNAAYNSAVTASLAGAVERTAKAGTQAIKDVAGATKRTASRIKSKVQDSERAARIAQTYAKAKERIKPAVEKGVERAGEAIAKASEKVPSVSAKVKEKVTGAVSKAMDTRDYNIVKKYLGQEQADKYAFNPEANTELLTKAREEMKKQNKTLKDRLETVKKRVSPKARSAISSIRDKLAKTIRHKSPSTGETTGKQAG